MRFPQVVVIAVVLLSAAPHAVAQLSTKLKPETVRAFDSYVKDVESGVERRHDGRQPFLWVEEQPDERAAALRGEIVTEKFRTNGVKVPDGMLHDWIGAMFVPGATGDEIVAVLQDFDRHADYYSEVIESRLLGRQGDVIRSYLKLRKHKVITAVLNTEHEARYQRISDTRWAMRSRSTKIAEVKDQGEPSERELPVGEGNGFLWRLNAYWRIEQQRDGTWVELRTVSLSRDIPFAVSFIVRPFVTSIPVESLRSTLEGTRNALNRAR